MKIYGSTFNCKNCNNTIFFNYYKLPDGKIICPKCYDKMNKCIEEINTYWIQKMKLKDIEIVVWGRKTSLFKNM